MAAATGPALRPDWIRNSECLNGFRIHRPIRYWSASSTRWYRAARRCPVRRLQPEQFVQLVPPQSGDLIGARDLPSQDRHILAGCEEAVAIEAPANDLASIVAGSEPGTCFSLAAGEYRVEHRESFVPAEPIFDRPLHEISFGRVLARLLRLSESFHMPVQPQLLLLQKNMMMAEGGVNAGVTDLTNQGQAV